jgi:FAD-dependent oxidoreductase domain-containing protein 1
MKYDVVVVGSGIVGLSSAYHLKRLNRDLKIVVVDRYATYAQGNTAKATAGFRDLYSSEVNYKLANSSISFYSNVQKSLDFDMGMHFVGYLFLLTESQLSEKVIGKMLKRGSSRLIGKDELSGIKGLNMKLNSEAANVMKLGNVAGGFFGENCGIFEPDLITSYYFKELQKMGVEFMFNTVVTQLNLTADPSLDFPGEPFLWQEKTVSSLSTNRGIIEADWIVLANDIWVNQLLDPLGIDSHMRPKKRQVFQVKGKQLEDMIFDCDLNDEGIFPMTIVPKSGVHFRPSPKEREFRVSGADEIGRPFGFEENPEPERSFYEYSLKPVLQEYFPAFAEASIRSMWAGYYSYNTIDSHPYIFKELNIIIATGTSGSGLMKGDAIGRIVEGLYSGRKRTELFGGKPISTTSLGIAERNLPPEDFVL